VIAALGVALLGAFLVTVRRREFAILATVGTGNKDMLVATAVEGAAAVLGTLIVGIPIGLALALLAVRVLGASSSYPPRYFRAGLRSHGLGCTGTADNRGRILHRA
jgi:ABC-type antimicrobial peptide transport system permease subunit